jgi:hypothetical protein
LLFYSLHQFFPCAKDFDKIKEEKTEISASLLENSLLPDSRRKPTNLFHFVHGGLGEGIVNHLIKGGLLL